MNKIYLDPALREFGELLNHVVKTLRASPDGVAMNEIFTPRKVDYIEALVQLEIISLEVKRPGPGKWIRPGRLSLKNLKRIIKGINLVYWYLLAGDSDSSGSGSGNDALLKHLLEIYELPTRFFTGIGLVLTASGLTRLQKGELELLPGNMRKASIRAAHQKSQDSPAPPDSPKNTARIATIRRSQRFFSK